MSIADRSDDKLFRSLFGGGAKARRPQGTESADIAPAGEISPQSLVQGLNLKVLAAALVQGERAALTAAAPILEPVEASSRPPRLEDVKSAWFAYWTRELKCEVRAQRKLWEMVTVLQAFYQAGVLTPGARAVGFGVGDQRLPSYLGALGLSVVAADQPGRANADQSWIPELVSREVFDAQVEVSDVDVRRLDDPTLRGFDACWSSGLLGQLDSFEQAEDTLMQAMDVLKPGGVAVHVADFAFAEPSPSVRPGALCFSRGFFEAVAKGLNGRGHTVAKLDFDLGRHPLDGYIDTEPFDETLFGGRFDVPHLKVLSGGALRTSFAMIVTAR